MSRELKHLLLATTEDSFDSKAWSGIPFSLRSALERQVERVSVFRPPPPKRAPLDVAKRVLFGAKKFPLWITEATLRQNAQAVQAEIARTQPDAVLSISSQCVAYLDHPGVPAFLFSDAPYLAFCEAYAPWETPPRRIHKFAAEEARTASCLDGLFFGSAWACGEAKRLYELRSAIHLHETPLGANWVPRLGRDEIFGRINQRNSRFGTDGMELLFVGKDWERKGGPLAVDIAAQLHRSGQKVRLHVVGCRPELGDVAAFVTVHGPLYPDDPGQNARLTELFLRSHFLLVPTLAECFGIVFADAQAFGLPPISRDVHAVPSIVLDGKTGMLFDRNATVDVYVKRILALLFKPDEYQKMSQQARMRFEERLSWDRTAESILAAIRRRLAEGSI